MTIKKRIMTVALGTLALSLAITIPTLLSASGTMAQTTSNPSTSRPSTSSSPSTNSSTSSGWTNWLRFFRPPTTGVPSSTGNGSSREGLRCSVDDPFMQPILPDPKDGLYGFTLEQRPEIFVEIPKTSAQKALLVFRHETDGDTQRVFLPIPAMGSEGATVSFRLPDEVPGLLIGETYQWSLTFICGDYYSLNDPTVIGWVQRQEQTAELDEVLGTRSPQAQIEWLGENGYWYDLVARLTDTSNLTLVHQPGE